jgi:ligand-binding sensor domain-containing protein
MKPILLNIAQLGGIKKLCSVIITIYIISYFLCPVSGQDKTIRFQTICEGLSNNHVKTILMDSRGFMWFGTNDGLNKFNGLDFDFYENNPSDSTSLSHNSINIIKEDRLSRIWVGTANGLVIYNRDKDNFERIQEFAHRDILYVTSIFFDENDVAWIGTSGNGIYLYDYKAGKLTQFSHSNHHNGSLASNFIVDIVSDGQNIWIGTRNGLNLFNKNDSTFLKFAHDPDNPNSLSNNIISSLAVDRSNAIWIGTFGGGLNQLTLNNKHQYEFQRFHKLEADKGIKNNILALCPDYYGNIWIGIENGGLSYLDRSSGNIVNYKSEDGNHNSLISNSIWSIYEDKNQILWIGTYNKGVNIIDKHYEKFNIFQKNPLSNHALIHNSIKAFSEDKSGLLWIATDGAGVCCFNPKTRKFIQVTDNKYLSSLAAISILADSRQNVWVGTWGGGVERLSLSGQKVKNYRMESGFGPGNNVMSLYEDKSGVVWAGSYGKGLYKYNPLRDEFEQVIDTTGKTQLRGTSFIGTILEDSHNNLWVGTLYGLVKINRSNDNGYLFSEFGYTVHPGSISSFRITTLFEDSQGVLWVGTDDGLNRLCNDGKSFKVYQKAEGLPSNYIKGILEDAEGSLWISTNKGLTRFRPDLDTFYYFTKDDGLASNEFNNNACIMASSGEFFFGTTNGINSFFPDSVTFNNYLPPVYITNFEIMNYPGMKKAKKVYYNHNVTVNQTVTLSHEKNSFKIDFVALNYTRPEKNRYKYKLEGFDKEWNGPTAGRSATYTNLSAGSYTFFVIGSNNDGLWNQSPAMIDITILPSIWKTNLAYVLYTLIIIAVSFGFIRLWLIKASQEQVLKLEKGHREKEEALNQLKIQFFTNLSHELRTPLTLIVGPLNKLLKEFQNEKESVLIRNNVNRLKVLVDQILDFRMIENERMNFVSTKTNINVLVRNILVDFSDFAHQKSIQIEYHSSVKDIELSVDEDKIKKIISNLLTNSLKFTPPGEK